MDAVASGAVGRGRGGPPGCVCCPFSRRVRVAPRVRAPVRACVHFCAYACVCVCVTLMCNKLNTACADRDTIANSSFLLLPSTSSPLPPLQGDMWELYIPSDLAYGESQRGQHITPGAVLIFKLNIIDVLSGGFVKTEL